MSYDLYKTASRSMDEWEQIEARSQRHLPKNDGYVPWGTNLVEGAKDLAGRAVNQLQEWAKDDPDTWTDDLLRLTGGGIKNVGNTMADWERRSEEGEVGIRSATGSVLRFMNWSSEQGARLGRTGARAIGVNEELGGFLGSFLPEAIGTKGLSKAAQVARSAKQIQRLNRAGYAIDVGRAAVGGGFGAAPVTKASRALKMSGQQHKALRQLNKGLRPGGGPPRYLEPVERLWQGKGTRTGGTSKFSKAESASQFVDNPEAFRRLRAKQLEGLGGKQSPFAHHHIIDHQLAGDLFNRVDAPEIDKYLKRYGVRLGDDERNIIGLMDEKLGSWQTELRKGIQKQMPDPNDSRSIMDLSKQVDVDVKTGDWKAPDIKGRSTYGAGPEQYPGQLYADRYKTWGIDRKQIKMDPEKHILGRDHLDIVHRTQELPMFGPKTPNPRTELKALIDSGEYWHMPPQQAAKLIAEVAKNQRNIALNTAQWRMNLIKQKMGLGKIIDGRFVPSKFKHAPMRRSPEAIRDWVLKNPREAAILGWGKSPPKLKHLLKEHGRVTNEVKHLFNVIDDEPVMKQVEALVNFYNKPRAGLKTQ